MLTKNAINNMKNRYAAVLKKCRLMNIFGSLAITGLMTGAMTGLMTGLMAATLLCAPAYASTPDVTVTTEAYTEANAGYYYMTYTVPVYDATSGTYTSTTYGVYLNGGTTSYTGISALTEGLILGTTAYDGGFTSIEKRTDTYSLTVNGVDYYLNEAIQTGSRVSNLLENKTQNFIGISSTNNGGAIYNGSTYNCNVTGDFIGNNVSDTSAYGGSIYNSGKINDITGAFIGNYTNSTDSARGGAIYNTSGTINSIAGSFIGNYAESSVTAYGGAIYNVDSGIISSITGSFIGNYTKSDSARSYGGAIYNESTISSLTGSFIGNYAESGASTTSSVYGGAIYNAGTISDIAGSFIGNYAYNSGSSTNTKVYGGAIYNYSTSDTTGNLTFLANNAIFLFTDNYTLSGSTKDYNFITSNSGSLTFTMQGTGGYILNDSIVKDTNAYTLAITGEDKDKNTFSINDEISGFSLFTVENATLSLGSYKHENGTISVASFTGDSGSTMTFTNANLSIDVTAFDDITSDSAALTGANISLTADASSSLVLTNASSGNTYTIAYGFKNVDGLFTQETTTVANSLLEVTSVSGDAMTEAYTVTVGVKSASAATGASIYNTPMAALLYATASSNLYDADSISAGASFIYNTMENTSLSDAQKIQVLEGAAQMAAVSGVQAATASTISAANTIIDTRMLNASSTNPSGIAMRIVNEDGEVFVYKNITELAANDVVGDGPNTLTGILASPKDYTEIWLMPMYAHETVSGLSSGYFSKTGYSSDMYGVALGIDRTFQDSYRMGLAFDMGFGDAQSSGDYVRTTNDYDFFGFMAYGALLFDNLSIMGSAGYTKNASDVAQDLSAYGQSNLYANVDSNAWNFSLKAAYACDLGEGVSLSPYAGVQYMIMTTDGYSVNNANNLGTGTYGATVFNVASDSQNVWSFPLGVTLSKEYHSASGWDYTPNVNVGAIFATGDLHATSVTTVSGIDASSSMSLQVIDDATLDMGLGLSASKGDVTMMLDYDFQYSEHRTAHGLTAKVMFAF